MKKNLKKKIDLKELVLRSKGLDRISNGSRLNRIISIYMAFKTRNYKCKCKTAYHRKALNHYKEKNIIKKSKIKRNQLQRIFLSPNQTGDLHIFLDKKNPKSHPTSKKDKEYLNLLRTTRVSKNSKQNCINIQNETEFPSFSFGKGNVQYITQKDK
jgi:hypothetical protein